MPTPDNAGGYSPVPGGPPTRTARWRAWHVALAVLCGAGLGAGAFARFGGGGGIGGSPATAQLPFTPSACVLNDGNRMRDEPKGVGGRAAQWLAPACQRALFCGAMPMLVLDRPCTVEDLRTGTAGAVKHLAPVLISHRFRVVYVANPTSADYLARAVMERHLGAEAANSTAVTPAMRAGYFFFSFSERAQDRFFFAVAAGGALGAKPECAAARAHMHALLEAGPAVHTQAFVLSAAAGASNKMIAYDWLEDAGNVGSGLVDALLRVQLHAGECLPDIDFDWLNFEVVRANRAVSDAARGLQACSDAALRARVLETYEQDTRCFGA